MSDAATHYYNLAVTGREFADIDVSTSGDNTIIAGEAGKKIVIYAIFILAGGAVTALWKTGSVQIIGPAALAANGGYHLSSESGVAETAVGDALVLNISANVAVGGVITYAKVDA